MVAPGLMPHAHAFPAPLQAHDVSGLALPPLERSALFFDVDGTLLDICPEPRDVVSDGDLRGLLEELLKHCHGALALVSGRALDDIDRIFSPLKFIAVGLHGAEIRDASGAERRADPRIMDHARKPVRDFVASHEGLMLEDKGATLAVHYRNRPELGAEALRFLLRFSPGDGLAVQEGKFVVELKHGLYDKGTAIAELMRAPPFEGRTPVFFGDDLTDEAGFALVNQSGGMSVRIGSAQVRTQAARVLPDIAALRALLMGALREARP
jgi:trehalose 6-phosphate phosphatase